MDHPITAGSASRFEAYVEGLVSVIGDADRAKLLRDYCVGLMMPCERIELEKPDYDRRTFECMDCNRSEILVVKYNSGAKIVPTQS